MKETDKMMGYKENAYRRQISLHHNLTIDCRCNHVPLGSHQNCNLVE